jgi:photosystem II stability/assembly factor-like uncharacterized protein
MSVTNTHSVSITVTGTDFAAVLSGTQVITPPTVRLNGTSIGDAGWMSTTTLTTTVPAGFPVGVYTVTVTNPDALSGSLPNGLTVQYPVPALESVNPVSGMYGQATVLTVVGTSFIPTPAVSLGESPCIMVGQMSSTTLTATVPNALLPGVYDLVVSNPGPGSPQSVLPGAFSLYSPTPVVTMVEPTEAPNDLDTEIAITGTNFVPTPTVSLGAMSLDQVTWISPSRLNALVPWGMDEGTYDLTVANPDPCQASASLTDAFTVTQVFNVWTTGGPYGGFVRDVTLHPVTPTWVYAAVKYSGLFFSDDGGDHWQPMLLASSIHRAPVSFDTENEDVMYFGIRGGDANIRSQDGGTTWEHISPPNSFLHEFSLIAHPVLSDVVYATASASGSEPGDGGIYRSDDRGDHWISLTLGLTDTHVTALAFHPDDADVMLAGTRDGHVFTSTNSGGNWNWAAQLGSQVERLNFNPIGDHEAWAVLGSPEGGDSPPFLYRSTDLAVWEVISESMPVQGLAFHPTISGTLWAATGQGVYASIDGGDSWSLLDSAPGDVVDIAIDPVSSTVIYVGTRHYGVFRSADAGNTWLEVNQGLGGIVPSYLAVSPHNLSEVYASAPESLGLLKSNTGGSSWHSLDIRRHGFPWSGNPLAIDPVTPTRVYLGEMGCPSAQPYCDVFKDGIPIVQISEDGGENWRAVSLTVPSELSGCVGETFAVAPHPDLAGRILAGVTFFPPSLIWAGQRPMGGIYASDSYGEDWTQLTLTQPISGLSEIVYDPTDSHIVYAGTGGTGLLRSDDNGQSWEMIPSSQGMNVEAVAVDPRDPNTIYVSGGGIVSISQDGGETWEALALPLYVRELVFTPREPSILYVAGNGGVYRVLDEDSWQLVPGIPHEADVKAIAVGTDEERVVVYIGSSAGILPPETRVAKQLGLVGDQVPGLGGLMSGGVYRRTTRTAQVYLPLVLRSYAQ